MNALDLFWLLVQDAFWSAVAAAGFAVLFNVPRRTLWGCVLVGAIGHATRTLVIETLGLPVPAATLVGAICVGFVGVSLARRLHAPSLIFNVTGSIPMVPGLLAYSAMLGIIQLTTATDPAIGQQILVDTVVNAIEVCLTLGAIAFGIIMPKLLFQRSKPVV